MDRFFLDTLPLSLSLLLAATLLLVLVLLRQLYRFQRQRDILLQEKDVVFNFVYDIGEDFAETEAVDLDALLKKVVSAAQRTSGAVAGAILYLVDTDDETLHVAAMAGVFPPLVTPVGKGMETAFSKIRFVERLVRRQGVKVGEGMIGDVVARGLPILIPDAAGDSRVPRFEQDFLKINSLLMVPMRFRHKVFGVLAVVNRADGKVFGESDLNLLQALADQASISIRYAKFVATLDEKRRLDYDLGVAKKIQTALLPKDVPHIAGVDLAAFSVPAQQIGGDYYDFVDVDDHHIGMVIADVSGKGISGAIMMSICRSVLRVEAPGCLSPATVLKKVNRVLNRDLSEDMFISILYMIFNTQTHELVVARGGHVFPILTSGHGETSLIKSGGMAIGLTDTAMFDEVLEEKSVHLKHGDMVVAYTDGVTEARNRTGDEWGTMSLARTIRQTTLSGGRAAALTVSVRQKLLEFVGDVAQYDDMTLVCIKVVE